MTNRRYPVFILMFLAVAINYMDRVNFSVSIPSIQHDLGFSLQQIGWITFAWAMAYALFNFPGGWLIDRIGLRYSLPLVLGWWSAFTIATPFARSLTGWFGIRALMGAGEAPIWPLNAKLANSWASPKERSTLYTLVGSGQYLGPFLGTVLAGFIVVKLGWHWAFTIFGIAGLLLLPFWIAIVRDRPSQNARLNEQELAHIGNRAPANEKADWPGIKAVFFSRTGIALLLIYLTFGYILFTFLNWMPTYMHDAFHMGTLKGALWSSLGYFFGFLGFAISGPFNDRLVARYDRLTARRIGTIAPMFIGMLCMIGAFPAAMSGGAELTAVLIGFAQLFMNMTVGSWAVTVIDISPNQASTGFVYGIYNGVLNIVGALNSIIIPWVATNYGFPIAFGSAVVFMAVFMGAMLFVVDRPSYERLIANAEANRAALPA